MLGGGSLEDDLDEADFFTQQSLFEEARAILETLLARHPNHPLVTAKMRDLEAMEQARGRGSDLAGAAWCRDAGHDGGHERRAADRSAGRRRRGAVGGAGSGGQRSR